MDSDKKVSKMRTNRQKWFTRQNGEVKGPFTLALLKSNWLLGRLQAQDEVSEDGVHWRPIGDILELSVAEPTSILPADNEQAKRYLDERDGFDRRQNQDATEAEIQQRVQQRRAREPHEVIAQRQLRTLLLAGYRAQHERWFWPICILVFIVIAIFMTAILYPTAIPETNSDCEASALPNVNWENCVLAPMDLTSKDLSGSNIRNGVLRRSILLNTNFSNANLMYTDLSHNDLSYSDLSTAQLKGADLRNSDLSNSDLTAADLSFADLRGANIGGVVLDNAILNQTIWVDGRTCAPQSVGDCL